MWAAGGNQYGQLGTYSRTNSTHRFVEVLFGGVKAVAAGSEYSMVLKQDGSVWAAGRNQYGQLGDGSNTDRDRFVEVISTGVKALATGLRHTLVVQQDGSVWTTGHNMHGQLGDRTKMDRKSFARVRLIDEDDLFEDFKNVMMLENVDMWSASANVRNQLTAAKAVSAGVDHSMVLRQDGSVWAAGGNFFGQIGDGSTTLKPNFVRVIPYGAKAIAAGGYHSMVLKGDGTVWATGGNGYGQLGDESMTSKKEMHLITVCSVECVSGVEAKAIAAGFLHSMVLYEDGSVWVAGANHLGQLGDGTAKGDEPHTPFFFEVVSGGARAVATGYFHSMIRKRDGTFWGTGANSEGQLGDGSTTPKDTFVRVAQPTDSGAWYIREMCGIIFGACLL